MAQTAADCLTSSEGRHRWLVIFAGARPVRYGSGIPCRPFRRLPLACSIVGAHAVEIPEHKLDQLTDVDLPELPVRPAGVYWPLASGSLEDRRDMLGAQNEPFAEGGVRGMAVLPGSPAEATVVRHRSRALLRPTFRLPNLKSLFSRGFLRRRLALEDLRHHALEDLRHQRRAALRAPALKVLAFFARHLSLSLAPEGAAIRMATAGSFPTGIRANTPGTLQTRGGFNGIQFIGLRKPS